MHAELSLLYNCKYGFLVTSHYIYCILQTLQLRKMGKSYENVGKWVWQGCVHTPVTCATIIISELYPAAV